jgi:hypothetical protein
MTRPFVRLARRAGAAAVGVMLTLIGASAAAQGTSTAAVTGQVLDEAGTPVPGVTVTIVSTETGARYSARPNEAGRYSIENVHVGAYRLEARALGFEPYTSPQFVLILGQRLVLDVTMRRIAVEVGGVTVTAETNPLVSPSRTGASTFVSDEALHRLPTLNRSFDSFLSTAPQVVGRSFAGQNDRFNNIQIDGTVNNDLFALGSSNGTPGGGVNARPLSLEAVREYQILIAPFDVRQGGFVGGLVNAVTKSGTNALSGSVFGYFQNQSFLGTDTAGISVPVSDFSQQQFGFSLGGPIIRDRLHFFTTADIRRDLRPFASSIQIGPDPTNPADTAGVGITQARADSVQNILISQYGLDPGSWRAPNINNPETNLFAKLDYQFATNNRLEVSGIIVNANQDKLIHQYTFPFNGRDGYELSNSGYNVDNSTRTLRSKWTALIGNLSNEAILGYTTITDDRRPATNAPLILVAGNTVGTYISAGAERFSHANLLEQRVVELTDNLTFSVGQHLFTVGTHNEFFHFRNVFFPASLGVWNFGSPDSLRQGLPNRYEIALPTALRPDGPTADFNVQQIGFYGEDRFSPIENLSLTLGLRMDVPMLPSPARNPTLDTISFPAIGRTVNTSSSPSGNPLWSPRFGFNYDVTGRQKTIIRGGAGIFSGRPPYVWVSNAFGNTGLEQQTLICAGNPTTVVPAFTVDPANQPQLCRNGTGPSSGATSIVFYDENFKFPQAFKLALGVDQELGWGVFGTIDFIYTKAINQYYLVDVNLRGIQNTAAGEGGRNMYGTINPATGAATALRVTSAAAGTIININKSADQSTSLSFQVQKRFGSGIEFNAAYTYSHVLDLFSFTSDITGSNFNFAVLDGTIAERNLRTSVFDRPHKISLSGTVNIPFDVRFSLIYNGLSGTPFTYVVANDANGDGVGANDPVYVPRDQGDITLRTPTDWTTLNNYINNEPCLNQYRGSIMPRNKCRNAWQNQVNARLSKVVRTIGGQSLEITADMLNVLNFLNSDWGLLRQTGVFEETNLIRLAGYDQVNQRGIYTLNLPTRKNGVQLNSIASRWVFQLGARYVF